MKYKNMVWWPNGRSMVQGDELILFSNLIVVVCEFYDEKCMEAMNLVCWWSVSCIQHKWPCILMNYEEMVSTFYLVFWSLCYGFYVDNEGLIGLSEVMFIVACCRS